MVVKEEIKQKIIEKYNDKTPVEDIAKDLKVPLSTCYYIIKKNNDKPKKDNKLLINYKKITDNKRDMALNDDYLEELRGELIYNALFDNNKYNLENDLLDVLLEDTDILKKLDEQVMKLNKQSNKIISKILTEHCIKNKLIK